MAMHLHNPHTLCRYSVGLGLVEEVLRSSHFLNIPNSYFGLLFFPMMLVLGRWVLLVSRTYLVRLSLRALGSLIHILCHLSPVHTFLSSQ